MSRFLLLWTIVVVAGGLWPADSRAQSAQPLSETQRQTFERAASELQAQIDLQHPRRQTPEWADAALFAKGLTWALRYDPVGVKHRNAGREKSELVAGTNEQRNKIYINQNPEVESRQKCRDTLQAKKTKNEKNNYNSKRGNRNVHRKRSNGAVRF